MPLNSAFACSETWEDVALRFLISPANNYRRRAGGAGAGFAGMMGKEWKQVNVLKYLETSDLPGPSGGTKASERSPQRPGLR